MDCQKRVGRTCVLLIAVLILAGSVFAQSGTWTVETPMLLPVCCQVAGVIGSKIFVAGGSSLNVYRENRLQVFDTAMGSWVFKTPMPTPRLHSGGGAVAGKFYVVGGGDSTGFPTTIVEVYDPVAESWSAGPAAPHWVNDAASAVVDGKLYIIGGGYWSDVRAEVQIFNPSTGQWTLGNPMPTPRGGIQAAAWGTKIYVVGGWAAASVPPINKLEIYDTASNTWATGLAMPTARGNVQVAALDGRIYVAGGFNAFNYPEGTDLDILEIYDPVANTWSVGPTMPVARSSGAGVEVNGAMYVAGGTANVSPEKSFVKFQPGPPPPPPAFQVCLLYDSTKAAKSGSTIPIKVQLCNGSGANLSSPSLVLNATSITLVSGAISGQVQDSGNANPDFNFRYDATLGGTGGYIFNLSTKGLATGSYDLNFQVTGSTATYAAPFQVK